MLPADLIVFTAIGYVGLLFVIAFLGKPRTEHAHHATEAPIVMLLPLVFLAVLTVISPWDWAANMLEALKPHHAETHSTVDTAIRSLTSRMATPMMSLSTSFTARPMISRWPLVMGSKVPG